MEVRQTLGAPPQRPQIRVDWAKHRDEALQPSNTPSFTLQLHDRLCPVQNQTPMLVTENLVLGHRGENPALPISLADHEPLVIVCMDLAGLGGGRPLSLRKEAPSGIKNILQELTLKGRRGTTGGNTAPLALCARSSFGAHSKIPIMDLNSIADIFVKSSSRFFPPIH